MSIHEAIRQLFSLVQLILIIRILLTWFPNIKWWEQPFKFLHDATEPILAPFKRLVPPIGGLDLSPIFAFLFLNIIETILLTFI